MVDPTLLALLGQIIEVREIENAPSIKAPPDVKETLLEEVRQKVEPQRLKIFHARPDTSGQYILSCGPMTYLASATKLKTGFTARFNGEEFNSRTMAGLKMELEDYIKTELEW